MMHVLLAQIAELRGDEQVVGRLRASATSGSCWDESGAEPAGDRCSQAQAEIDNAPALSTYQQASPRGTRYGAIRTWTELMNHRKSDALLTRIFLAKLLSKDRVPAQMVTVWPMNSPRRFTGQ